MPAAIDKPFGSLLARLQYLLKVAKRLLQLEHSSRDAITNDDLATTEAVLTQKQALIEELLEFPQLRKLYDQASQSNPDAHLLSIETTIVQIDSCMNAVRQSQQETIDFVREQHRTLAAQLETLVRNHSAAKSYRHTKKSPPSHRIDISG